MTEERKIELKTQVFMELESSKDFYDYFRDEDSLDENIYLHEAIMRNMLPIAQSKNDYNTVTYLQEIMGILKKVIVQRLFDVGTKLYILYLNNQVLIKEKCVYIAYTDEFQNNAKYEYKRIANRDELASILINLPINGVVVTDGPNYYVRIDAIEFI